MITLDDARLASIGLSPRRPATGPVAGALLNGALFITILISSLVFIEPSPYEAAAAFLGFACIVARVKVDKRLLSLIVLLALWNFGGLVAIVPYLEQDKIIQFVAVSFFMAFTAVIYACLLTQDSVRRITLINVAYILAGVFAALVGVIGYFEMFPGAGETFSRAGRAQSTFKDPNVFGPFLIFPILLLVQKILSSSVRLRYLAPLLVMLLGLFLSFSRGAWFHFFLSAAIMIGLMLMTASDMRMRARIIFMVMASLVVVSGLLAFSLSFDAIGDMFSERAKLIQSYDAGTDRGRFYLQSTALDEILQNPFGVGPFEFSRIYGLQQHNVYLQAFLVYGWLGGFSYFVLVILTLVIGLRTVFVVTPWQPFLIVGLATFAGAAAEGAVIDTDHWRHFFLLLGIVWGLAIATMNQPGSKHRQDRSTSNIAPPDGRVDFMPTTQSTHSLAVSR